jgi:hypothetical protein
MRVHDKNFTAAPLSDAIRFSRTNLRRICQFGVRLSLCARESVTFQTITELGFVRVLIQAPQYGFNISQARTLLLRMKTGNILNFTLIADNHGVAQFPRWVKTAKQTTNGHLLQLARANGAVLATLDRNIRGACVIPAAK